MKTRKGNPRLTDTALASESVEDSNVAQIPISSIVIEPWIKKLIRPRTESEYINLKADIQANGLTTAIVLATVDEKDNCLIDGHGRVQCYQDLGKPAIPFVCKQFETEDEIKDWVFRKQLGRRNLTKQDRAYLIGSINDSKPNIAKEFSIGMTNVADARNFYKAVNWLSDNERRDKDSLLEMPISSVIKLHKKLSAEPSRSESGREKKAVTWKLSSAVVSSS